MPSSGAIDYPDTVSADDYPVITSDILKYLYLNKKNLYVNGDGYTLIIRGENIVNYMNNVSTEINLCYDKNKLSFELNNGKKICGEIELKFDNNKINGNYLYLYNSEKEKYDRVNIDTVNDLVLNKGGKYLITSKKLSSLKISYVVFGTAGIGVVILGAIYIILKKKYWFW